MAEEGGGLTRRSLLYVAAGVGTFAGIQELTGDDRPLQGPIGGVVEGTPTEEPSTGGGGGGGGGGGTATATPTDQLLWNENGYNTGGYPVA